ncbi:chorismate mutase [Parafrankia discariae]|uniref:chorismate mutase n=1 Tax=Parafrankia discariae TaxID=365528 RepID=UPI00036C8B8B|nr:chorismate mutase [Parafrankia discariae]
MTNAVDAASGSAAASSAAVPADAQPAIPQPGTDPSAPRTIASIDEGRQLIDDIDARLRELVTARKELSRQVQALRAEEGGPRIQHGRENEIIASWADDLGPRGVEIAVAVLTLCRGNLP